MNSFFECSASPAIRRIHALVITPMLAMCLFLSAETTGLCHEIDPRSGASLSPVIPADERAPRNHSNSAPEQSVPPSDIVLDIERIPSIDLQRLRAKKLRILEHTVQKGENYWSISRDYRIDVKTLLGANPSMDFTAMNGQILLILERKGVLHAVAHGEKLGSIAQSYGTTVKRLKEENRIPWWRDLREGEVLFVADVDPIRMNNRWKRYYESRGIFGAPFASWGKGWSSLYGIRNDPLTGEKRMHRGMDFKAAYGTDVFASATGRVVFAGVSGGYGKLVQIRHNNVYTTYYGHLSAIYVKNGQKVRRGQRIGKVGTTGRVTGPHLHFEIRRNGVTIDPLPLI